MGVIGGTLRAVGRTVGGAATATTMAAGAIGGAAIDGTVGALKGAAEGVRRGADSGSHSMPAAALTLGALGFTGLVEWPVVLVVGGAAFVLRQLNRNRVAEGAPVKAAPPMSNGSPDRSAGSANSARPKTARKTTARRTTASRSNGTQARGRS